MNKQSDNRIDRLEETLAHLTRLTEDLSDVIARQDTELARLAHRVDMLMKLAAETESDAGGAISLADQTPPHW